MAQKKAGGAGGGGPLLPLAAGARPLLAYERESFPPQDLPEVAFAGRSNAGKSTLLNALTGHAGLARASRTPGRTRTALFIDTALGLRLVDLPGYGYGRMSRAEAAKASRVLDWVLARPLRALVLVMDARRDLDVEERQLIALRARSGGLTLLALNKIDRLNQSGLARRRKELAAQLRELPTPQPLPAFCSATKRTGLAELVGHLRQEPPA